MQAGVAKQVEEELSGQSAKSYVAQIVRFHRVQASTMFHEAAEYIRDTLHNMGISDAKIERFKSDGHTKYWTWTSPIGWSVESAELRMTEPEKRLIARFRDVPTCLHTHSNSTPPEGVSAELVDVGKGTKPEHYEGKDVAGKFVLATGRAKPVHEQAVFKRKAAAVITDTITYEMKNIRESVDIPDAHAYQSIWPTKEDLNKVTFGFSLSKRQGNHLRSLIDSKKKVVLKAHVDAQLFPSNLDVVTATIQGGSKPDEEVFLIAHLCHPSPSANDNASGSGLLLEIARTMQALITSGRIQRPARTTRFLWVPETYGTIAYLHNHEGLASKMIAGINLDMVGQDQEQCRSTLNLDKTPDSNPSFLNDYILSLIERSTNEFDQETAFGSGSTFRYSVNPFSGGSDHSEFNEATFRVPCVMLIQWPDLYYHTSMDSIDKVSQDSLKRVGWIAAVATLTIADAGEEDTILIADMTRRGGIRRLMDASERTTDRIRKADRSRDSLKKELGEMALHFKNKIRHIEWREKEAIRSIGRLEDSAKVKEAIKKYTEDIDHHCKLEYSRIKELIADVSQMLNVSITPKVEEPREETESLTPKRLFKGTLSTDLIKRQLGEKEYEWYEKAMEKDRDFRKKTYEIVNFMDGRRTVRDITAAVSAEYGRTDPQQVLKFIRDLEKMNLASLGN